MGLNYSVFASSTSPTVTLSYDAQTKMFTCECNGDYKSLKWIKNGQEIQSADLETTLIFNGTGTYGCLINDNIYQESFMQLPFEPELKSSVGSTVENGSNVTLTCTARSQISNIMWMLDEFPLTCDQKDECIIGN